MHGYVELGLIGGGRAHQFALGVGRHDGSIREGETVDGAEGLAMAEHWGHICAYISRCTHKTFLNFYINNEQFSLLYCLIKQHFLWHYLPADVSWQKTSLRRSGGGTSGCSASPDPPSPASWTPAADWYPGTLSYLNKEDRIREALVRYGSKNFYTHIQTHTIWADEDSMSLSNINIRGSYWFFVYNCFQSIFKCLNWFFEFFICQHK